MIANVGQSQALPPGDHLQARGGSPIWSGRYSGGPPFAAAPTEHWRRFVPGELLVKFRKGASFSAKAASLSSIGAVAAPAYRSIPGLHRVRLPTGISVPQAVAMLGRQSSIEYAEPNFIVHELRQPDDERFGDQWPLNNIGGNCCATADADIDAAEAWDITTGSSDVVVAVIDSGVDFTHPDLVDNMYRSALDCNADGVDDDGNGYADDCHGIDLVDDDSEPLDPRHHGTHVAGIIGARGNNGLGVSGVAWDVRIVACRFINEEGSGEIADAIGCLDYVAGMRDAGLNVVATNNSWGGGPPSRALDDAVRAHRDRGILLVAAAGNESDENDRFPMYPCTVDESNVICVGASTWIDNRSFFSNTGRHTVHLFAPGETILSTIPGASYEWFDGTSMAAPHVTGVVALLAAWNPAGDWRARKNLILSTVDRPSPYFEPSIAGGRLNAFNALTCTSATLLAPLRPMVTERIVRAIGTPLVLKAIHIRCDSPAGPAQVSISGGETVVLEDNGAGDDDLAGDGVYAGRWTPQNAGEFELSFVGSQAAPFTVTVDPMLRQGFPATMLSERDRGWWWGGAGNHVLVGDIDGDAGQEILVSGFSLGPLYAWNDDGTAVRGWPALDAFSTAYPVLGEFDGDPASLEVASESFYAGVRVYDGNAILLPGWPRSAKGLIAPPAATDLDGDGVDEILTYPVRRSDGTPYGDFELPIYDQTKFSPNAVAVVDLDGDSRVELVLTSEVGIWASNVSGLFAGFPVQDPSLYLTSSQMPPVIGDVDADGEPEIIVFTNYINIGSRVVARIYSWDGELERSIALPPDVNPSEPALADLDGDGVPEILFQTDWEIHAWRGDGTEMPGWPAMLNGDPIVNTIWRGAGGLVIGDLNGDVCPEVVTTHGDFLVEDLYPYNGKLRVIDCHGNELPGFPKALPSMTFGMTPAISDLDHDGRNELVIATTPIDGERDSLFVYELDRSKTHGPIEWGQYMADARHSGYYPLGKNLANDAFLTVQVHGSGRVRVAGGAIDCGEDCIERYAKGTTVTLTASTTAGAVFEGWRGACSGAASNCTVTVNELTRVSAWFTGPMTVTVTGTGAGTVTSSPSGIICPGDCNEAFEPRTVVTLTATPAAGSDFDHWSGSCSGTARSCTLITDQASNVTAHFVNRRALTIVPTGTGHGRFVSSPAGLDCGTVCTAQFEPFATVTLTFQPNNDTYLTSWNRQGCVPYIYTCVVTMATDHVLTPTFALKPVLTVIHAGPGQGTIRSEPAGIVCEPTCSTPMLPDTGVNVRAFPDPGSYVIGFTGDCQQAGGDSCNFFMRESSTVTVTFGSRPLLMVSISGNGQGRVTSVPAGIDCGLTCQSLFTPGTQVTLTATADAGSRFDSWSDACAGQFSPCTATVNLATTVGARFTAMPAPGGGGGGGGGGSFGLAGLLGLILLLLRTRHTPAS